MNDLARSDCPRGFSLAQRLALWGGAAALLLIPLIAMQFTREVAWTRGDFAVFGAMLVLLGGAIEMAFRFAPTRGSAAIGGALALLAFLAVWAELAVGIFD